MTILFLIDSFFSTGLGKMCISIPLDFSKTFYRLNHKLLHTRHITLCQFDYEAICLLISCYLVFWRQYSRIVWQFSKFIFWSTTLFYVYLSFIICSQFSISLLLCNNFSEGFTIINVELKIFVENSDKCCFLIFGKSFVSLPRFQ